jgi:hypothetical protein
MKYPIALFAGILISSHFYVGCNNSDNKKAEGDTIIDSPNNKVVNNISSKINNDIDEEGYELRDIYNSYISSYDDSTKIDRSFTFQDNKVQISVRHYTIHDSLVVPDRYTEIYSLKKFTTPAFESSLKVMIDGQQIFDTIIKKRMFNDTIHIDVKKYGVLLSPAGSCHQNHFIP